MRPQQTRYQAENFDDHFTYIICILSVFNNFYQPSKQTTIFQYRYSIYVYNKKVSVKKQKVTLFVTQKPTP